ncbi:MAG: CheY-like chemotaxis protein [Arenicella sp.]
MKYKKINKVLLVDDNEASNNYNKRLILSLDLADQVSAVLNGQKAFDYIELCDVTNLPNVIILDINMPVTDGFEFLKLYDSLEDLKKKNIVIVMLTTSSNPIDRLKTDDMENVAHVFNKPLLKDNLIGLWEKFF